MNALIALTALAGAIVSYEVVIALARRARPGKRAQAAICIATGAAVLGAATLIIVVSGSRSVFLGFIVGALIAPVVDRLRIRTTLNR